MKNIVSTIIVFGSIFILIVAGAFIFDKFNGFGLIDNVDSSLNSGLKKVLENEDNITKHNGEIPIDNPVINNDNITKDNSSADEKNDAVGNNMPNTDNFSDNITIDNSSILKDNESLDNNIPSDNVSDGIAI